jgi:hypothetical protein
LARLLVGDSYARGRISRGVILSQDEQPQHSKTDANTNTKPWWQSHNNLPVLEDNEYES